MTPTPEPIVKTGDRRQPRGRPPIVDARPDGSWIVRAAEPLGPHPMRATTRFVQWAVEAPDRVLLAWRGADGAWRRLHYGEAWRTVERLAQALLSRRLSPERPLAVLSGAGVEHLLLSLAAQHVGVPYVPISPAYSLASKDYTILSRALQTCTPGLIFVDDGPPFERALAVAADPDIEVVFARRPPSARTTVTAYDALTAEPPTAEVEEAHASVGPQAIAKLLFTSGSTGAPKAVINTHRMLCSNRQMIAQAMPFLAEEPPVLVDWLPWHHTFGGNHNLGLLIDHGGALYIDEGKPLPGQFGATIRNLREIAPTLYLNVPKGFEELVRALRADAQLAATFFSRLHAIFYAAASLSQPIADELCELARRSTRRHVPVITGFGSTETAPLAVHRLWDADRAVVLGLPAPGVDIKLAPVDDKLEIRVRGPNVTPGYWRNAALTRDAFDADGFYRMGDAVCWADAEDRAQGLVFDGRIAEDFKLSSGAWVSVGPLRARVIAHLTPYIRDVVIAGHDRDVIGALMIPDVDACRELCADSAAQAPVGAVLDHPVVRERIAELLASLAASSAGSATRVVRAMLLHEPPSLDAHEITDKGSINQRALLTRRASLVAELYAAPPPPHVITVEGF